jgi:DNA-binding NtrC family response regulator
MKTLDDRSGPAPLGAGWSSTVLVADDEQAVRRLAVRILECEGFVVIEAQDGAEALEVIRLGSTSCHVVVSDIVMPRLNGVELMQALASSHPDLPVILMSGYATAELNDLGIAPPCSVLVKPFPPERLVAEVRRCLELNPS